jgi:hypothetical protein
MTHLEILATAFVVYFLAVAGIIKLVSLGHWRDPPERIRGDSRPVTPLDWRKGRGRAARHRVRPPRAFPGVEW